MNFLLVTIGSHGDVHPFVGLGAELLRRGHRAKLVTNGHFEVLARRSDLEFAALGSSEEYIKLAGNPELWSVRNGWRVVFGAVLDSLRKTYDTVVANLEPDTVVIGSSLALAARVAQEVHGFRMATVHLSPSIFRSSIAPPKLPGLFMPWWFPLWLRKRVWLTGDRWMVDPLLSPPLNTLRAEHGLKTPVTRILDQWWASPDLVIGMFPEWFGPKAPDWPAQTVLTGFPMFDERGHDPLPDPLVRFLDERPDDKPVAFTPGSAMLHGHEFFAAAAEACARMKRRGVLLSRHLEHIPGTLPDGVIHVPYAPFSELLPRCAALVHHGGIGTTSQALRAGTPQLIMAMTHDQPDNAERVRRLGVGVPISTRRFTGRNVARGLQNLLSRPGLAESCISVARRFMGVSGLAQTATLIEGLGMQVPSGENSASATAAALKRAPARA